MKNDSYRNFKAFADSQKMSALKKKQFKSDFQDDERSSRLRRAMSFSSKSVGPMAAGSTRNGSTSRPETPPRSENGNGNNNNNNNNNNNKNGLGLLGSVKSLYATIRRKGGKENKNSNLNSGSTSDLSKFDNGVEPPQRPPRKHQVIRIASQPGIFLYKMKGFVHHVQLCARFFQNTKNT